VSATAKAIAADYEQNEIAADERFKGRRIRITGTIHDIGKDILDAPYLSLGSGSTEVQATFERDEAPSLARLLRGQIVSMTCVGAGKLVWPLANHCRLD
jgi:tRNA_anti-like